MVIAPALAVTGKRKRTEVEAAAAKHKKVAADKNAKQRLAEAGVQAMVSRVEADGNAGSGKPAKPAVNEKLHADDDVYIQIVAGSYEKVLHGVSARVPKRLLEPTSSAKNDSTSSSEEGTVSFADTFLFAAHTAAVRCLALSPQTENDKRYLATGGSDERINVYSISTVPPASFDGTGKPSLAGNMIAENASNRAIGNLIHHDRAVTRLEFPAKGKLFSAAEDSTIAISRTRDWTMLSSIKAPIPKAQGRPSGDTAGPGETPAGVNGFAIHPSQKLMLSVGKGERSLRLWNLMTGKKAGVLNFDRDLLTQVGEGKYGSGEGRNVLWDGAGENYTIGFERGAALFGMDSKAKAVVKPTPNTKLLQMKMVRVPEVGVAGGMEVLAASTEDGRVLFFDLSVQDTVEDATKLPLCPCTAQLGGRSGGVTGRIKDFEVLTLAGGVTVVVTASSDGAVRLWSLQEKIETQLGAAPKQVGRLLATVETGNRITCLGAFIMDGKAENAGAGAEDGFAEFSEEEDEEEDDEDK